MSHPAHGGGVLQLQIQLFNNLFQSFKAEILTVVITRGTYEVVGSRTIWSVNFLVFEATFWVQEIWFSSKSSTVRSWSWGSYLDTTLTGLGSNGDSNHFSWTKLFCKITFMNFNFFLKGFTSAAHAWHFKKIQQNLTTSKSLYGAWSWLQ